jgi:phosphoribosylformimino-5-aminoimidazole carboxamide ribotide isomerase
MKIIPAVDIKEGQCVRLVQGKVDQKTVYSNDPLSMANHWDEEGAQTIHVVDLDGAFQGSPINAEIVKNIIYSSSVDIQVGGGIRTLKTIETYAKAGAYRIILGTVAQQEPEFVKEACKRFPNKIIVGIDARDGLVAVKGWVEVSEQKATDLAQKLKGYGIAGFIFTDISRDGMLQGPNLESIKKFAESAQLPVIASGGVSRLEDIKSLANLESYGVEGVIVGKALYDKTLTFKEAQNVLHAG